MASPKPRLLLLAMGVALLVALPAVPVQSQSQVPCSDAVRCPDLITDTRSLNNNDIVVRNFSPTSCSVVEGHTQAGQRTLLRFTFNTPNIGTGDLVVGRPADHPEWFEWAPCHNHYHFREYADYRLWKPEGYALWVGLRAANPTATAAQVLDAYPMLSEHFVAGGKQGFCVIDLRPVPVAGAVLPSKFHSCGNNQGISVGWADEYSLFLDGQWIDITGVPGGVYVLEAEVNAERLYVEHVYSNNAAAVPVRIP